MIADNQVLPYIHQCKLLYTKLLAPVGGAHHLTRTECDILLYLHNNPTLNTAKDIVLHRRIAKSNVSTALETLKTRGFVAVEPEEGDRRTLRLFLTPAVTPLVEELAGVQVAFVGTLTKGLSQSNLDALERILHQVEGNVVSALAELEKGAYKNP